MMPAAARPSPADQDLTITNLQTEDKLRVARDLDSNRLSTVS
jgi:hypothetical protein